MFFNDRRVAKKAHKQEVKRTMKAMIDGKSVSKKEAKEAAKKFPLGTGSPRKFPLI
jgi:hypothetical protein